ncbi:MAG: ORF6N domain-containing protein [Elusimicrobiota bacterium]|jgi:hypothetical protein|nr:ORF6N domain-containing protein [Elusimicrobiota bacterium]
MLDRDLAVFYGAQTRVINQEEITAVLNALMDEGKDDIKKIGFKKD